MRKVDPVITCSPWNPVAMKKVDSYTLSEIVKGVSQYSEACRSVKYMPRAIVIKRAWSACLRFPSIRLWQAQVVDPPEASSMEVLRSGTSGGFRGRMPVGGQHPPNSGVGARLEWQKAQKKPVKKRTSEIIGLSHLEVLFFPWPLEKQIEAH